MRLMKTLRFPAVLFTLLFLPIVEQANDGDESFLEGKAQYNSIVEKTKTPQYGPCWKSALHRTEQGCKELTNTVTHLLAYDFTRCFYMELGNDLPECETGQLPNECKQHLTPQMITGPYAMFFMHTRQICFFLESQAWQQRTEETIDSLSRASSSMLEQLEDAELLQAKIRDSQLQSIKEQQIMRREGNSLISLINSSRNSVTEMFEHFQSKYQGQLLMFTQVFDKISVLEQLLLEEYAGIWAFLFWFGALIAAFVTTATRLTQRARFWLYVLTFVFAALEITVLSGVVCPRVCVYLLRYTDSVCMYRCVKLWRYCYAAVAVLTLIHAAVCYEDFESKTYNAVIGLQNDMTRLMLLARERKDSAYNSLVSPAGTAAVGDGLSAAPIYSLLETHPVGDGGDNSKYDSSGSLSDSTYDPSHLSSSLCSSSSGGSKVSEISSFELDDISHGNSLDGQAAIDVGALDLKGVGVLLNSSMAGYNLRPRRKITALNDTI